MSILVGPDGTSTLERMRPRRIVLVQWLRRTHGWIGLWGAALGLLFGTSGIWLNHRAVLKLPAVAQQRHETHIALPDPAPADATALAAWLQDALQLEGPPNSVRIEPARPVPWSEREGRRQRADPGAAASAPPGALMQPEHWILSFGGPQSTVQVERWAGNRSVSVRRVEHGVLSTLMNLHKGVGMPVAWILLVDTLAGSILLLSLTGLALWLLTHRRRGVGLLVAGTALAAVVGVVAWRV